MIQPARVLPSNAPPLQADDSQVSGVLQEQSGNHQYICHPYANTTEQKCSPSILTENAYPAYQSRPPIYRQTPVPRYHGKHIRGHYNHDAPEEHARREKEARFLYHRFQASDHYNRYRARQKEEKCGQEQKWPDRLELAFFQALIRWPPMGRRKLMHKDKQRGRNELIADHIEELTGEVRSRKQVSSHIQVLKPFVEHDAHITKWLSKRDLAEELGFDGHGGRAASLHHGSRRALHNPRHLATQQRTQVPAPSVLQIDLSAAKGDLAIFEPNDFQMFVQRRHAENDFERLHTYTSSIVKPRQDDLQLHQCQGEERQQHDCRSLDLDFPLLAEMHKRRPLDCNVLNAEASLAFPTDGFRDHGGSALPGVELGISFLCTSAHLPLNAQVRCKNTFYKDGILLRDYSGTDAVTWAQSEDGKMIETAVKFGSTFWAKTLNGLASKLRNLTDPSKARDEVSAYIQGITASQEIVVVTMNGYERLLVIHWKFRLSSVTQGRAYWYRILLPKVSSEFEQLRTERVDSVFDYGGLGYPDITSSQQPVQPLPVLQSPFEYDSSSGSALSATGNWPTNFVDSTDAHAGFAPNADNSFDFNSGDINISYDQTFDFSAIESSAFGLDRTVEFSDNPALQDYSQATQVYTQPTQEHCRTAYDYPRSTQDYSQDTQTYSQAIQDHSRHAQDYMQPTDYSSRWTDNYSLDAQQSVTGASNFPVLTTDLQTRAYGRDHGNHDTKYEMNHEEGQQAYQGAGQHEGRDEDALAMLAAELYAPQVHDGLSSIQEIETHHHVKQLAEAML